jgi:hypothetical protein
MRNLPTGLDLWTADEVAECISYEKYLTKQESSDLYRKLWGFLAEAEDPTPLGGDGSNGTVELPCGRLDVRNDDKAGHWWHKLSEREQNAIAQALDD